MYTFEPSGVCSDKIMFSIEDGKVRNVTFFGGCEGNSIGVSQLVEGMAVDDAIERLRGIPCGDNPTSCPDQLAVALSLAAETNNEIDR
jgi:uncharacterized protein (TIGR03905 family)